ncbi:type I restriction-modification system subunit M [Negativicoccus succinicivorans]
MDKQKLASTLWSTVEDLRGNVEAYTYKDYILGLLFYKFLSDKEYKLLNKDLGLSHDEIAQTTEEDEDIVSYCKNKLGYFIEPKYFYQSWVNDINNFTEDDLITALNAYERHIPETSKHVFGGVFDTISRNLTALAPTSNERTKSLRNLLLALRYIPTVNTEYDVLGYVYEYLISQFSAGAGKKGGEFFTPTEVSTAIARIINHHLKTREAISVLDPTAGSGSLLLAVGNTFEKAKHKKDKVKYYYQEITKTTFDMCRQNLVMRGIKPANMVGRNGDTLGLDYPYFDERDRQATYEPVFVDAVVSNPPYSQNYDPSPIRESARFAEYGLPPASKGDYAFLLHGLYHLKSDGIMVIVLPHGVLFRNEEADIRTTLIKKHQIEAVIGLPPNIFFGTGIPTTFLVLRKQPADENIYFIDASKGFIKDGNKNKLRESDIQRIVDAYISKKDIEKYARLVSYKEIAENEFNLNISRYVSSEEDPEVYDAYGVMNGAIPKKELEEKFEAIRDNFPGLYGELFKEINSDYVVLDNKDIIETVNSNAEVQQAKKRYHAIVDSFAEDLRSFVLDDIFGIDLATAQFEIKDTLFEALKDFPLIDRYVAYQSLYQNWAIMELDIEALHEEKLQAARNVVEVTRTKTKANNKKEEVFDHWEGRIIPFALIQNRFFKELKDRYEYLENRKAEIKGELDNLVSMLDEEEGDKVLNDSKDAFSPKELKAEWEELFEEIDTPEITGIKDYFYLLDTRAKKEEKETFMRDHPEIHWEQIPKSKDCTVTRANMNRYYKTVQAAYEFAEDSYGYILSAAQALKEEESTNNKEARKLKQELQDKSVEKTQALTDTEIYELLDEKWLTPVERDLKELLTTLFNHFENDLNAIVEKYGSGMNDIAKRDQRVNRELKEQLSDLQGSDSDMKAIQDFMELLGEM